MIKLEKIMKICKIIIATKSMNMNYIMYFIHKDLKITKI